MRILQVISSLRAEGGGPIEGLIQYGIRLKESGHTVHTVALDRPGLALDPRMASDVVYLLGPSRLGYGFALRLEPWLRENIQQFDVVVVHGMWQYHSLATAKACRALKVPYVVFLHGMLDPWFARRYPLKHLKKWLYWPWAEYRTLRDAHQVLFTTAEELRLARESFWLYRVAERLVGYGIADRSIAPGAARQAFMDRFPALAETRNLLYLSRLHPKKGCELLIEGFASIADADARLRLVLAGPAEERYRETLEQQIAALGITDRVIFTGMLRGELKWGAYDASELFVLPSHQENFGIVLAEALASGLPVLTTYQVNIWREIQESGAGLICKDDAEGVRTALHNWQEFDGDARVDMGERARRCFLEQFEIGKVARNLESALQDSIQGTRPPHTFTGKW